MTTAHRATWTPAKGGKDNSLRGIVPSKQISAKDIAGHTKLKLRQPGQNTKGELIARDLRDELQERELKVKNKEQLRAEEERPLLAIEARRTAEEITRQREQQKLPKNIDADDSDDSSDESSSDEEEEEKRREDNDDDDSDSDSDDDEDEEAELLREMEKIRKEREEEALRKKRQEEERERRQREAAVMTSNPLLSTATGEDEGFAIKRKWFDDSIFKNQAKGAQQPKKRFINDTVRNDFHRKFLDKYIQ